MSAYNFCCQCFVGVARNNTEDRCYSFYSSLIIGATNSKGDGGYEFIFLKKKLMYLIVDNTDLASLTSIGVASSNTNNTQFSSISYLIIVEVTCVVW